MEKSDQTIKNYVAVGYYHQLGGGPNHSIASYDFYSHVENALQDIDDSLLPEDENEEMEVSISLFQLDTRKKDCQPPLLSVEEFIEFNTLNQENYTDLIEEMSAKGAQIDQDRQQAGTIPDVIPDGIRFCHNFNCLIFTLQTKCPRCQADTAGC